MLKRIIPVFILFLSLVSPITSKAQFIRNDRNEAEAGWQNLSYEKDGIYGAAINQAHELTKGKKSKKTVVVALIGSGIDLANKDINEALWRNRKDKPNGRDDDRNGLIDDIHGWNFLGGPGGEVLNKISRAADREFIRLKDEYGAIAGVQGKFYTVDTEKNIRFESAPPANLQEYEYYRTEVMPDSPIARSLGGIRTLELVRTFLPEFDSILKETYGEEKVGAHEFAAALVDRNSTDTLRDAALSLALVGFQLGYSDWDSIYDMMKNTQLENAVRNYERDLARLYIDDRRIVGDDPYDIDDRSYGNNNLMSDDAGTGTMQAGIIAGRPDAESGTCGICPAVKVMALRIDADFFGEPYMKDMALAIRYAVDHGADIIQMGKTNTFYPRPWSEWVDDALMYAESKGVLVVMGVMDLSYNLDDQPFYPRRMLRNGHELTNFMTVAASDMNGNPMLEANFSRNELDIFAPGVEITSSYLGDTQAVGSGSYLAASVVTGVAALIKSYYPKLTPAELRGLLMENATSREGGEIEKEFYLFQNGKSTGKVKDLFLFEDMSRSAGIVNAFKTLQAAAGTTGK